MRSRLANILLASLALALQGCDEAPPVVDGGPPTVRRLSEAQYRNIIADVFGETITVAGRFDPIDRADDLLSVGAGFSSITPRAFETYDALARNIAAQVVARPYRDYALACAPAAADQPDDACATSTLQEFGRLLFRRPLTSGELESLVMHARDTATTLSDFHAGLAAAVAVLLESPPYLYVTETTEPDPTKSGGIRLKAYSKASRLSFFLWNTTPDADLLAAAERGDLHTENGLAAQVERMMASPRLEDGVRGMFTDIYGLDKADHVEKDAQLFPAFVRAVAIEAREQTLRTIVDVLVAREGDYRELFTTRKTFMSPALAIVHRVAAPRPEGAWAPFEFAANDPRMGIVSHLSLVAAYSHPGKSSPTLRGRAIRERLLCQRIPDPPPDVNFDNFNSPDSPAKTARERLTLHSTEATCAGCHKLTDPIGLTLEKFDGAGQLRTTENGVLIDVNGELNGITFADAPGLAETLSRDPALPACLVNRIYSYATGRRVTTAERAVLEHFNQRFADDQYRFLTLVRRIAASSALYAITPNTPETKQAAERSIAPIDRDRS